MLFYSFKTVLVYFGLKKKQLFSKFDCDYRIDYNKSAKVFCNVPTLEHYK